jgi:hypothetical protein
MYQSRSLLFFTNTYHIHYHFSSYLCILYRLLRKCSVGSLAKVTKRTHDAAVVLSSDQSCRGDARPNDVTSHSRMRTLESSYQLLPTLRLLIFKSQSTADI